MKIREFVKKHKLEISFSFFLFCFALFLMLFLRIDTDYFWHYKAGEEMVTNSTILTKDIFSWSLFQYSWISHEWLFEVLLYSLSIIFGRLHLFVYAFVIVLGLLFFIFFVQKKEYLKNLPFALLWTIFFMLIFVSLSGRPQLLSFFLLAVSIYLVYYYFYHPKSKRIFFLVPIWLMAAATLQFRLPDGIHILLFALSFLNSFVLLFLMRFLLGLMGFWFTQVWILERFLNDFIKLFSGVLIPIWFFPLWLQRISDFLPFKYIYYAPISLFIDRLDSVYPAKTLLFQLIWIGLFYMLSQLVWRRAVEIVTIQGG